MDNLLTAASAWVGQGDAEDDVCGACDLSKNKEAHNERQDSGRRLCGVLLPLLLKTTYTKRNKIPTAALSGEHFRQNQTGLAPNSTCSLQSEGDRGMNVLRTETVVAVMRYETNTSQSLSWSGPITRRRFSRACRGHRI